MTDIVTNNVTVSSSKDDKQETSADIHISNSGKLVDKTEQLAFENSSGVVLPPDGGWGWVVLGACLYISITHVCVLKNFGIIFSDPLIKMNASSTYNAWILNIHTFLWFVSSTFSAPFCEVFSWRSVGVVTFSISSAAFALLSIASNPFQILMLFSVVFGITGGLSSGVCFLVLPAYFDQLKGAAMAAFMTGISFGMMVMPPIITALTEGLGYRGCTLVYGGILSVCVVSSLTFHPVELHQRTPSSHINSEIESTSKQEYTAPQIKEVCHVTRDNVKSDSRKADSEKGSYSAKMKNLIFAVLQHLKEIRQLRIIISTLSYAGFLVGFSNYCSQLPFLMEKEGYTPNQASWCLSASALGNTTMSIIFATISDRKWFSRKVVYTFGIFFSGIICIVMLFLLDQYTILLIVSNVWGVCSAGGLALFHALLQDTCGRELYVSAISLNGITVGFMSIVVGPFFGVISDMSNYTWSMTACGALQMVCVLPWLLMPCAARADLRRSGQPCIPAEKSHSSLQRSTAAYVNKCYDPSDEV